MANSLNDLIKNLIFAFMSKLLESCLKTLYKTRNLLTVLEDEQFTDKSVAPYYSSIGSHIRHILDFYNCIVNEKADRVNLMSRERNLEVESSCTNALKYLAFLENSLKSMNPDEDRILVVTDDLGCGSISLKYTFGALMAQANSHTIHHYAIINYILEQLGITIEDSRFGFNPTTPKTERIN